MQATTLLAAREVIATAVLSLNGRITHPEHRDHLWNRVRSIKDIDGAALRNFLVRCLPATEATDGIYGDGREVDSVIEIWTCYGGIEDDADGPMIDADARQLYLALVETLDPANDGISAFTPTGWVYEDDAPGKVYGYHTFVLRFLHSDTVAE